MGLVFIRTAIIFIVLFAFMRLMGKRQIGEMQPFELVITLLIAELACIPMADASIPLLYGIISIITIFLLHQLLLLIDLKLKPLRTVFEGKPAIIINKGGIDISQMKKNNLDLSDLIESMRSAGCFSLDDALYALYESNGNFSVLQRNKTDENCKPSLPIVIIENGNYNMKNLEKIKIDKSFFDDFLKQQNYKSNKIFVLSVDGNGKIYIQAYNEKYKTMNIELPEGCEW